ncbi:MAG: hypothetical protein JNK82_02720 [Myxococcaceae bacterium]|nr:hypothetical protein [Myxococcaceae bacterium]
MLSLAVSLCLAQVVVPPGLGTPPGGLDGGTPIADAFTDCRQCHDRVALANPAAPFDGWASSMMALSLKHPLFNAALTVAEQDLPGSRAWCLRCHAPQSYVRGQLTPSDHAQGVTCDACHRSIAPAVIGNAQLTWERSNVKYGPYPDLANAAHTSSNAGITASSELCGQCHHLTNPFVPWRDLDDGGYRGPEFPLDTTYDEWSQSQYARPGTTQTCQDCHLPRVHLPDGGDTQLLVGVGGLLRTSPRSHALVGGNVWGLDAVQRADPAGTAALSGQLEETKRLTRELLSKAATLQMTTPATVEPEDDVAIYVRVDNKTGHKLPTGFADGRRIVVQVLVDGKVLTGGFDGGHVFDDGWLRIYEAKHGTYDAGIGNHFVLHDTVFRDTRLPPAGFAPPPGAPTRPMPEFLYQLEDGGYLDYDEVVWHAQLPPTLTHGQSFDITARLLYQSTSPAYVRFLRSENHTDDAGQQLLDVWSATAEAAPIEMLRVVNRVTVVDPLFGKADSGTPDAGDGGSANDAGPPDAGPVTPRPPDVTYRCGCSTLEPGVALLLLLAPVALLRRRRRIG